MEKIMMPSKEEIGKMYLTHTYEGIGMKYHVSRATVYQWLVQYKLIVRVHILEKEEIAELINKKLSFTEMGKELNCSPSNVRNYAIKYGLHINRGNKNG